MAGPASAMHLALTEIEAQGKLQDMNTLISRFQMPGNYFTVLHQHTFVCIREAISPFLLLCTCCLPMPEQMHQCVWVFFWITPKGEKRRRKMERVEAPSQDFFSFFLYIYSIIHTQETENSSISMVWLTHMVCSEFSSQLHT